MKNLSLTYCTNVHALGNWQDWQKIIADFGPNIRKNLDWDTLPLGLWFSSDLIQEIKSKASFSDVKNFLESRKLSTFTFNTFPYGNFHDKVVKTKVYSPNWTQGERLDYTLSCAQLLRTLIHDAGQSGIDSSMNSAKDSKLIGSLSTLPLGWRIGWTEEDFKKSTENLIAFIFKAKDWAEEDGKVLRLGLEPEPGCILETTDQVINFWNRYLRPIAKSKGLSEVDLQTFCGLCYDTCHQAVQFENPVQVLSRLKSEGIAIVKMQLSSAIEFKSDPERISQNLRAQFIEERFLHQTRILLPNQKGIRSFDDLPIALALTLDTTKQEAAKQGDAELWQYPWRVHFHVPIHAIQLLDSNLIGTTREDMLAAFEFAVQENLCEHFEIETYTWNVLPESHRPKTDIHLAQSIADEMASIIDRLKKLNLAETEEIFVNGFPLQGLK